MRTLADLTLDAAAPVPRIVGALEEWGVVRLPGWLAPGVLQDLRSEFERLFAETAAWVRPLDYAAGRAVAVTRSELDPRRYPQTTATFAAESLREITRAYLGRRSVCNGEIWLTYDLPRPHSINELHYDRIPMLKFFVYLDDAGAEDGALRCVPGSQRIARREARRHRRRGVPVVALPNQVIPRDLPAPVDLVGEAGCLVAFTTDVYHQGGQVQPGHERRVMRAHSVPRPLVRYVPLPGTRQWWSEAPWNPIPGLWRVWDRVTGGRPS